MKVVRLEDTTTKTVERSEGNAVVRSYLGAIMTLQPGPQAFVVKLPEPGGRFGSHFHDIDQFQIVVGGRGRIGKEEWLPGSVHYADAFTPYGPIVGDETGGLAYLTLRIVTAGGLFLMPDSRDMLQGARGRNVHATFEHDIPPPDPGHRDARVLMQLEPDGVFCAGIRLGPGTPLTQLGRNVSGQYYVVFSGSIVTCEGTLGPMGLLFLDADEAMPDVQAGDGGCELLLLEFPSASQRRGSDPARLQDREAYVYPENH